MPRIWLFIRLLMDKPAESSAALLILNPDDNRSMFRSNPAWALP
jgi:hypothetical protein